MSKTVPESERSWRERLDQISTDSTSSAQWLARSAKSSRDPQSPYGIRKVAGEIRKVAGEIRKVAGEIRKVAGEIRAASQGPTHEASQQTRDGAESTATFFG